MINFVLQTPSLQHVTAVKVVASLWNRADIFAPMTRSFNRQPVYALNERSKEYKALEELVQSKVWALPLPEPCKQDLLNVIKPLGMEIVHWCHYHTLGGNTSQGIDIVFPPFFCWTMHGTIDYKKTAELLVKDERVDVVRRFEIACVNCLEDDARVLIKKISPGRRRECMNRVRNNLGMAHRNLIVYFTCNFNFNAAQLNGHFQTILRPGESIHKFLFKVTLRSSNRAAGEYFFAKLNQREKRLVLGDGMTRKFAKCRLYAPCNLLYYSSLMNGEQRGQMFRSRIHGLLTCFLGWPMQSLFLEAAKGGWQLMDNRHCVKVLTCICDKIGLGYRDYDYLHLFWECWRLTSVDAQRLALGDYGFLKSVFKTKREELGKFILNQMSRHVFVALLNDGYVEIKELLMDEDVISDAALSACKESAASESLKAPEDANKRSRSQDASQVVDMVMESRIERRLYRIGVL